MENDQAIEVFSPAIQSEESCESTAATEQDIDKSLDELTDQIYCRLCLQPEDFNSEKMISPCLCCDPSPYAHKKCFKKFILANFNKFKASVNCQLCSQRYQITIIQEKISVADLLVKWILLLLIMILQLFAFSGFIFCTFKIFCEVLKNSIQRYLSTQLPINSDITYWTIFITCINILIALFVLMVVTCLALIKPEREPRLKVFDYDNKVPEDPKILDKLKKLYHHDHLFSCP